MPRVAAKTAYIRARIEPEIKAEFDKLLDKLGLSMSDAIGILFRWSIREKRVPSEVKVPTAELRKAMAEARAGKYNRSFKTVDEMRRYYGDLK